MDYQNEGKKSYHKYWTKFELDLIRFIRDEYPCIYINDGPNRLTRVKLAWNDIQEYFKDVSVTELKTRWKSLRDRYTKLKKTNENPVLDNKYLDGTLSFLDDEVLFDDNDDTSMFQQNESGDLSQNVTTADKNDTASGSNIRQLIHEEIDILDDTEIKVEVDADTDRYETAVEAMINPDTEDTAEIVDIEGDPDESLQKWEEEELLNATRLTQEMIEELIYIKTKNYYMAPATSHKKQ